MEVKEEGDVSISRSYSPFFFLSMVGVDCIGIDEVDENEKEDIVS